MLPEMSSTEIVQYQNEGHLIKSLWAMHPALSRPVTVMMRQLGIVGVGGQQIVAINALVLRVNYDLVSESES